MSLQQYRAKSGSFIPVWTLEIQTVIDDVDKILDAVMAVYPLAYGRYRRNASISATGMETAQPQPGSTTERHIDGFEAGATETYPMVEVKISLERDLSILEQVMDAIHCVHDLPARRLGQPRQLRSRPRQSQSLLEQRPRPARPYRKNLGLR